jgi:hypothetical protein
MRIKRIIIPVFAGLIFIVTAGAQAEPDYAAVFGQDWQKAEMFLQQNDSWIRPMLKKNNISWRFAMSIVFPELVRYSALRDKMEITLLKTLYINLGDDYADFSIGPFQMKPSFAEIIRKRSAGLPGRRMFEPLQDKKKLRSEIVSELEDPAKQMIYLIAFIRLCEKEFKNRWTDEESKIKFIATAYNAGPGRSAEEIERMTDSRFFNTRMFRTENYCYSDVSLFWYRSTGGEQEPLQALRHFSLLELL